MALVDPVDVTLKPWQTDLEATLTPDCVDDRTINFYVDSDGGAGKTWFQRYMTSKFPDRVQLMAPGRFADMAYAVDASKDIFLFNLHRGVGTIFQYQILEALKDRLVFSSKYMPEMKTLFKVPHVVVFTNEEPDMTKLSEDRYNIINLNSFF
jgi:hypothetical protein